MMIGNCFSQSGSQFSKDKENCKFFYFISPMDTMERPPIFRLPLIRFKENRGMLPALPDRSSNTYENTRRMVSNECAVP